MALPHYQNYLSRYRPTGTEPDMEKARRFLQLYGLSGDQAGILALRDRVFHTDRELPQMVFRKDFQFISLLGGGLLEEGEYERFRWALRSIGESDWYVWLANSDPAYPESMLRFGFSVDTTWAELSGGDFLSLALLEELDHDYWVFGGRSDWGFWVANTYWDQQADPCGTPLRILGFAPEHLPIFQRAFAVSEDGFSEQLAPNSGFPDLSTWVPAAYHNT